MRNVDITSRPIGCLTTSRVICWDLDYTLLGDDWTPRRGSEEGLQRLSEKGYINHLTSLRWGIEEALEESGLNQYFKRWDGLKVKHEIPDRRYEYSLSKCYGGIAKLYGISYGMASHKLLVVGDDVADQPMDLDKVVFIHQPEGDSTHFSTVENIINGLQDAFPMSFYKAFNCYGLGPAEIGGVPCLLEIRENPFDSELFTPTIFIH